MSESFKETVIIEQIAYRKKRRNQRFLGSFLFLVLFTIIAKVIESVLLDLGFGINGNYQPNWWHDPEVIASEDSRIQYMLNIRPHIFWTFTQFTWLTTFLLLVYLFLRFFKYDENVPLWLRWISSSRSLTLFAAYDSIVGIFFWAGLATNFTASFSEHLFFYQIIVTVLVHAIIPILIIIYAIIVQVNDTRASMLREKYIIWGMMYPFAYVIYYIMISVAWHDPYPLTDLNKDFGGNVGYLLVSLVLVYIMLGLFMIIQNAVLLKFNKTYNSSNDYAMQEHKRITAFKAKEKAKRIFARSHAHYASQQIKKLESVLKHMKEKEKKKK